MQAVPVYGMVEAGPIFEMNPHSVALIHTNFRPWNRAVKSKCVNGYSGYNLVLNEIDEKVELFEPGACVDWLEYWRKMACIVLS